MPIRFLDERWRMPRVGRVRLGHKAVKTVTVNGKAKEITYPVADPFFVVPEELREHYGEQPTTLHIRFFADSLEVTFPHYLRRYTRSCLRCLGDGEQIEYRVNDKGEVDVSNGVACTPERKVLMDNNVLRRVLCAGDQCPHYLGGECLPTGFLRFVVEEKLRQGYYDLVCHQKAVIGIKTQLLLCLQMFGRLTDIPFLLHRGDEERVPVRTRDGIKDMPVRTQWIEIDPEWFQSSFRESRKILQESMEMKRLQAARDVEDLYGAGERSLPAGVVEAEFSEQLFNGEAQEGLESEEPGAQDAEPARGTNEGSADAAELALAERVRSELLEAASMFTRGREPSPEQLGLLAGKMQEGLQENDEKVRHLVIWWLWGRESSKDLSYGEVVSMLRRWLCAKRDSSGDIPLANGAAAELQAIWRQAQRDAGQLELVAVSGVAHGQD